MSGLCGFTPKELRQPGQKPKLKRARQFTIWALSKETELTHRQIGNERGASQDTVRGVLKRIDKRLKQNPLNDWHRAWNQQLDLEP